jgi:hypothetical protein
VVFDEAVVDEDGNDERGGADALQLPASRMDTLPLGHRVDAEVVVRNALRHTVHSRRGFRRVRRCEGGVYLGRP